MFFLFGTLMAGLAAMTLRWPATALDAIWRVNPTGQAELQRIGSAGWLLMTIVALVCLATAVGLWRNRGWGYGLAIGMLAVQLLGDLGNVIARGETAALVGLPIAGALLFYVWRARLRLRPADSLHDPGS